MQRSAATLLALSAAASLGAQPDVIFSDGFETGGLCAWKPAGCPGGPVPTGLLQGDLGPAPSGAFEVLARFEVRNDSPSPRTGVAFGGVPIPRDAALLDTDDLVVVAPGGRRLAAQLDVLARWGGPPDDGVLPIRWLEVTIPATVEAAAHTDYTLRRYAAPTAASDPLAATITPSGSLYVVDTGLATFTLDPASPALLAEISVAPGDDGSGRQVVYQHVAGAGPRLVFEAAGPVTLGTGAAGQVAVDPGGFRLVEAGPVKVVVALDGHFTDPAGASLCDPGGLAYERFGTTLVATFVRGSRDLRLELHLRNECSDAYSGPWTDQAVTVHRFSWELPLAADPQAEVFVAGDGPLSGPWTAPALAAVEQRKGAGSPWSRRARVRVDAATPESGEALSRPLLAREGLGHVVAVQMPWMRFREPQALVAEGSTLSLRPVSETLVVGEGKGIWSTARIAIRPTALVQATAGSVAAHLEAERARGLAELERGLVVRASRDTVNSSGVFPSLGDDAPSVVRDAYLQLMEELHDETVRPGGQWDRAKTFGSQLWPDVQFDLWQVDLDRPENNNGAMNYWNPSGAELLEFLRAGDPEWVWGFALPQSWLQAHTAYLNTGFRAHGNRAGFAVTSGGDGEGQWHRSAYGSDDYSYNQGLYLAYLVRPSPALRDRFAQAGRTAVDRYSIPRSQEDDREQYVDRIDLTRQIVQHFEMLANCAELVPGSTGQACHDRLQEILDELALDNLRAGLICQGDVPSATTCDTPQQFMQNALMIPFLHRMLRNYGDPTGNLRRALVDGARHLYDDGLAKLPNGVSLAVGGDWAAGLTCQLTAGGTTVTSCTAAPDSDGNTAMYAPTRPHTAAVLLMAHELDPTLGLCAIVRAAYDDPALTAGWQEFLGNQSGWWKGAAQMLQSMVFGVGIYDSCSQVP